jgi:hypothetical protein
MLRIQPSSGETAQSVGKLVDLLKQMAGDAVFVQAVRRSERTAFCVRILYTVCNTSEACVLLW